MRFEDLVADPLDTVRAAVTVTAAGVSPVGNAQIPTFDDLRSHDPGFFRAGITERYRTELSPDLHDLFWKQPMNATAMALFGYR